MDNNVGTTGKRIEIKPVDIKVGGDLHIHQAAPEKSDTMVEWEQLEAADYPLWAIHKLYQTIFSDKRREVAGSFTLRGSSFEYLVAIEGKIQERWAKVGHIRMYRRRRTDK